MERLRSVQAGQGAEFTRKIVRLSRTESATALEIEQLKAWIAEFEGRVLLMLKRLNCPRRPRQTLICLTARSCLRPLNHHMAASDRNA